MDVRMFTVGPVQENCFVLRNEETGRGVIVDPGDEAPVLLRSIEQLEVELDAILLTHTHFDHVGAVAPIARATNAPVYCPEQEVVVLQNVMDFVPYAGFGPFESWDPEHTLAGGEQLELAGFTIDVLHTPGHSPGHMTFSVPEHELLFSGDVLFEGSIGRTDLPGGDLGTLMGSIATLLETFGDDTRVHPGHMGLTTLGRERKQNPFVLELLRTAQQ